MNNYFDTEQLLNFITKYGEQNIRFALWVNPVDTSFACMTGMPIGFTNTDNPTHRVMYKITTERHNYQDGYRIGFTPETEIENGLVFGNERFYMSDFCSLIRGGYIDIYVVTEDGYSPKLVHIPEIDDPEESAVIDYITQRFDLRHMF
jgi:hypothetical protein